MSTAARQRLLEEIRRDLFSTEDKTVLKALHRCREEGDASLVGPLLTLYATTTNDHVRADAAEMLGTLKVSGTEEAFMEALRNPALSTRRSEIVAFMWNSGAEPVEHLSELTRMAVEGNEALVLEVLTLVESLDVDFPEEQVLDSVAQVREYLNTHDEDGKYRLIREYMHVLASVSED